MALYIYIKIPPGRGKFFIYRKKFFAWAKQTSPVSFLITGFFLLSLVVYPIFSYKLFVFNKFRNRIMAPISELTMADIRGLFNPSVAGVATEASNTRQAEKKIDYDLINNWFPTAYIPPAKQSKISHYSLSIPKLKIKNAVVEIGGTKLKKTLIHYPGTALPGDFGNTVIFGHSVLPMFYNPKNYKTIFSLIPTLKQGDKIFVSFDGIEYVYEVVSYEEVEPERIDILEQQFDQQTLSLVTCVPPGTFLRRGIIKARLLKF